MPLATELKRLRLAAGESQQDVAAALGVKRATVTQWESGRFPPSAEKLRRLDAHFGAEGALIALLGSGRGRAPVAAGRQPDGPVLADVFAAAADRLVRAVVHDPRDDTCVGWTHNVGRGRRPSPWSTAIGVRALLLLDRVDVDLPAMARTLGRRQHAGGWSNREVEVPRPDVTAVVLGALSRIGAGGADLDAAWRWLSDEMDPADHRRAFVLSTVLENLARLRPDAQVVDDLVRRMLDLRLDTGDGLLWVSNPTAGAERLEPSVVHTARAVVALRAAAAHAGDPEVQDAVGAAVAWLAEDGRTYDGITEILRIDPENRGLDVPVDHFTSAHVVRALAGARDVRAGRLEAALATLWASYVPAEGLWAWKLDGRLPLWLNFDAIAALRASTLSGTPVPHAPETGDQVERTTGGPPQPPPAR